MSHHFFALLSRMRYISRWGLMRSTIPENVQEHSHMVAVLAHGLAVIGRERFGGAVDPNEAAAIALFHDAPEILTGDLPTPVKYHNPDIRSAYQAVERLSTQRLLSLLPEELRPMYTPLLSGGDEATQAVVKAADKLAAYIKCVEELQAGNREFEQAAQQTRQALLSSPLPEVGYFMEQFLPGFGLTLDELQEETKGM